jgi:primosomal protein N' (replication factor Y)
MPALRLPLTCHLQPQKLSLGPCSISKVRRPDWLPPPQLHSPDAKDLPELQKQPIRQYGTGTERVEAEVQAIFPKARAALGSRDYPPQGGARDHPPATSCPPGDVLVGTQMLAKGLDLPLVTLVGVILADVGLNLPDIYATERTFQVLTQVAGRAGRSPLGGQVVLQTFEPEHYVIRAAAGHNFRAFYQQELDYRRRLGYPPFARLVRLEFRHTDSGRADATAQNLAAQIRSWLAAEDRRHGDDRPGALLLRRVGGQHRWQIILRP